MPRRVRVLLVLDQPELVSAIEVALPDHSWHTRAVAESDAAADALVTWRPDLILVDRELAGGEILARLGYTPPPSTQRLPIIAFGRSRDLQITVETFECGVDDLLTVPFAPEELRVRAIAVIRRTYGPTAALLRLR